jgi:zinc protease
MTPTRRLVMVAGLSCAALIASVSEARKIKPGKPDAAPPPAASPATPQKGASVEGITEYRLGNGLRVLLFPDQSK